MGSLAQSPALSLRDAFHIRYAVETGTWLGNSAVWLAAHFTHVWTIEVDEDYYWFAKRKEGTALSRNLTCVLGDSREKLAHVLAQLPPSLLWLDAHWNSGNQQQRLDCECPLLVELEAVRASGAEHYVLIDDASYFVNGDPAGMHDAAQWPSIEQVLAALPPGYIMHIAHDIIACVPTRAGEVVERWAGEVLA